MWVVVLGTYLAWPIWVYYQLWGIAGALIAFGTFPVQTIFFPVITWALGGPLVWEYWLLWPMTLVLLGISRYVHKGRKAFED